MEQWQLAVVILAAVMVGALVPVIAMFGLTLASVRRQIDATGARVAHTLDHVEHITQRVDTITTGLEGSEEHVRSLNETIGEAAKMMESLRSLMQVGSSVGASLGPAVQGFLMQMATQNGNGGYPAAQGHPAAGAGAAPPRDRAEGPQEGPGGDEPDNPQTH